MKWFLMLTIWLAAVAGLAGDDVELRRMLAVAATNRCGAYLETRASILALGTNVLQGLSRGAVDEGLTWQRRLVARICYERLVRGSDIEALRSYNWRDDAGYDKRWEQSIIGPSFKPRKSI